MLRDAAERKAEIAEQKAEEAKRRASEAERRTNEAEQKIRGLKNEMLLMSKSFAEETLSVELIISAIQNDKNTSCWHDAMPTGNHISVQEAYQAFVNACAAVPEEQFRAALSVLSEKTPYFNFEKYGYNSPERLKAQDAATKVFQRMYTPHSEHTQANNTNVRNINDDYTPRMTRH